MRKTWKKAVAGLGAMGMVVALSACGSGAGDTGENGGGNEDTVRVTLILKDLVNPFFVALEEGAQDQAEKDNVSITVKLISPIAMEEGLRFAIREGGKTVGAGVVAKILA